MQPPEALTDLSTYNFPVATHSPPSAGGPEWMGPPYSTRWKGEPFYQTVGELLFDMLL